MLIGSNTSDRIIQIVSVFCAAIISISTGIGVISKPIFDNLEKLARTEGAKAEDAELRARTLEEKLEEEIAARQKAIIRLEEKRESALKEVKERHQAEISEVRREFAELKAQYRNVLSEKLTLEDLLSARRMARKGSGKILLIDDNGDHRDLFRAYLQLAGFIVECADTGVHGLREYHAARSSEPFDLVVTDNSMPELTGIEVVKLIRLEDPRTRLAILTGHNDIALTESELAEMSVQLWHKPLNQEAFLGHVRAALAA